MKVLLFPSFEELTLWVSLIYRVLFNLRGDVKTAISVELVPRSGESLIADARVVAQYPEVTHINIPDIERFSLRSVEAIRLVREKFGGRFVYVPHIRATAPMLLPENFSGDIALIIRGDMPVQGVSSRAQHATECIASFPCQVKVMAGIDPYRSSPKDELGLIHAKIAAGATGFFTQPFFSLDHLRFWDALLPRECEIFYGISPVTTERSRVYWQEKNHAVFSEHFSIKLESQAAFARKVIRFARQKGRSVYLMPIRTPLAPYLKKVFG